MPQAKPARQDSETAIWKLQQAQECRAFARTKAPEKQLDLLFQADQLEADARTLLNPPELAGPNSAISSGGEMVMAVNEVRRHVDKPGATPDLLTVDASRTRLSLAQGAGVLPLALDAAESTNASNSVEQMLAHQIAAGHATAMQLVRMGMGALVRHEQHDLQFAFLGTEAVRLLGASARLMEASQRAALTLNRLKTAGRQTLVVQHVHVGDGGQAVVTGAMQRHQLATIDDGAEGSK